MEGAVDGVVLYNKTAYNIISVNHYTLFPLHPPLMNIDSLSRNLTLVISGA